MRNRYLEDRAMRRGRRDREMYDREERYPDHYSRPKHRNPYYEKYEPHDDYYEREERDFGDMHKQYHEDLERWRDKLRKRDKFKLMPSDIINKAKQMGVKFEHYSELEFEVVYYMLMSDFTTVSTEPHRYLAMAKEWLEDDDIEVSPSEKLCIYYYKIVKGED